MVEFKWIGFEISHGNERVGHAYINKSGDREFVWK